MRAPGSFAVLLTAGCILAQNVTGSEPVASLSLCALAANVRAYGGRPVLVSGCLRAGAEQDVLYHPRCNDGKPLVFVSFKSKVLGKEKKLRQIVLEKGRAFVVLRGLVHGPEPVKVDQKLPEWLKDGLKDSVQRYGHLGSLPMMIEVERVVDAREADVGCK